MSRRGNLLPRPYSVEFLEPWVKHIAGFPHDRGIEKEGYLR